MDADIETRFPQRFAVRVPAGLPAAVEIAARLSLTTPAEWARRALLDALQVAGVLLDSNGRIETPTPSTGIEKEQMA